MSLVRSQEAQPNYGNKDTVQKDFNLSTGNLGRTDEEIKKEVDKCALLCGNCHMEVHAGIVSLPS